MATTDTAWTIERQGKQLLLNPHACNALQAPQSQIPMAALPEYGPAILQEGQADAEPGKVPLGLWLHDLFDASDGLRAADTAHIACLNLADHVWLAAWITAQGMELETFERLPALRNLRHNLNNVLNNIHVNAELANLYGEQTSHADLLQALKRIRGETSRGAELVTQVCGVAPPRFDVAQTFAGLLDAESEHRAASNGLALSSEMTRYLLAWIRPLVRGDGSDPVLHLRQPLPDRLELVLPLQVVNCSTVAEYAQVVWSSLHDNPASIVHAPSEVRSLQLCDCRINDAGDAGMRLICWLDG